jgi:glycosyltransferase involved in cell wall biosynthesis
MKVLMTADTVGGVWTYAVELMRALAPQGVSFALATMGAPLSPAQRRELGSLPQAELFESRFALEWMGDPWDDIRRAGDWLLEIEAACAPDIVHLNGFAHGDLAWRAPVLMVAHSCVLSWWRAVRGEDAPATYERYRAAVTQGLRAADYVVAPTAAMLEAVRCHYGPLPRAGVVPNCRRAELFSPGDKEPFLFAAGRLWDEAKNIAALDAVAPRLAWPIYVAGDDCRPDGARRASRNLRLLGRLAPEEVAAQLARAAIYALPARYEPFGLSALEAGLSGCALVLGDIPSLREVWGEAALFVPPDDTDALATTLAALLEDGARRDELAACARRRALEYSPQRTAAGYWDAYRKLLRFAPGD